MFCPEFIISSCSVAGHVALLPIKSEKQRTKRAKYLDNLIVIHQEQMMHSPQWDKLQIYVPPIARIADVLFF